MNEVMKGKLREGILKHIKPLGRIENIALLEVEPGFCRLSINITEDLCNLYGTVHGGILYTLCDIASGIATYAYGISNMTLQGNINYTKAVRSGTLFVSCRSAHKGKSTAVNHIRITDEQDTLIASASMTMYITGILD